VFTGLQKSFLESFDRGLKRMARGLLDHSGKLDLWYEFESESQREALRTWCAANDIELED
jgi:hypothetical protein